jgi:hypothetical protein
MKNLIKVFKNVFNYYKRAVEIQIETSSNLNFIFSTDLSSLFKPKMFKNVFNYYRRAVEIQIKASSNLNFTFSTDLSLLFRPNEREIVIRSNGRYITYHSKNINDLKDKVNLMILTLVEFYNFINEFNPDDKKDFQCRTFLNDSSQRYYGTIQAIYSSEDKCFEIQFADCSRSFYLTVHTAYTDYYVTYDVTELKYKITFLIDSLKRVESEAYSGKF